IRLRKAALLLQSTDFSVSDIAHFVGYHNLTHFYRIFRESYDASPAEYRESHVPSSKYYN
ncbi:MAG: helix-turn-helix domain-containing protein, partial [Oscillospiraceae bacterium]|nr:helix-turn-helix domain-containing protein [Oscillospiraceae bacterium]